MANEEDNLPIFSGSHQSFDRMSIDELHDYIASLKNEIVKTEEIISIKKKAQAAASSVFNS